MFRHVWVTNTTNTHVKAHKNNEYNEEADRIAKLGAKGKFTAYQLGTYTLKPEEERKLKLGQEIENRRSETPVNIIRQRKTDTT